MEMAKEIQSKKINYEGIKTVASGLFLLNGYANTSMNDIADLLNIKKASLYHHIETREQLLLDIIQDIELSLKDDFAKMRSSTDYHHQKELFLMIVSDFYYHNDKAYLIIKLSHETDNHRVIKSINKFIEDWIKQFNYLLAHKIDKQLAKEMAESTTHRLIGTLIRSKLANKKQLIKKMIIEINELLDR